MLIKNANLWKAISWGVGAGVGFILFTDSLFENYTSIPKDSIWRWDEDIDAIPALFRLTKTLAWLKLDWTK